MLEASSPPPPPAPPPPPPPPPSSLKKVLPTHACQAPNRKTTLNVRNNFSSPDSRPTNLLVTSAQASTLGARGLRPYWNDRAAALSQRLPLPTVTASAVSPSISSNTYSPSILRNSWFSSTSRLPMSTNLPKISLRSTQSSSVVCRGEEPLVTGESAGTSKKDKGKKGAPTARKKRRKDDNVVNRALLVKVYPNYPQKQTLKRWMGLARFAYNAVVHWSHRRRCYVKDCKIGPAQQAWVVTQCARDKFSLFNDIRALTSGRIWRFNVLQYWASKS